MCDVFILVRRRTLGRGSQCEQRWCPCKHTQGFSGQTKRRQLRDVLLRTGSASLDCHLATPIGPRVPSDGGDSLLLTGWF